MIDFDALVLGPVYDTFGKPAVLTIGPSTYDLVVVDYTKGVTVEDESAIGVQTIRPAADVRRTALVAAGIELDDLVDGQLALNGTTWRIKSLIESEAEVRSDPAAERLMDKREAILARLVEIAAGLPVSRPQSATRTKSPNAPGRRS